MTVGDSFLFMAKQYSIVRLSSDTRIPSAFLAIVNIVVMPVGAYIPVGIPICFSLNVDLLGHGAVLAEFARKVPLRCFKVSLKTNQPVGGQGHLQKLGALNVVETCGGLLSHKGPRFWEGHPQGELPFVVFHVMEIKSFVSIRIKRL